MNMQEILSQVITSTNEIFEAEAGSVALLEPSGDEIVIQAAVGAGSDAVRGLSLPINKGVIGWVASNEQPALVPDVSHDKRFYQEIDKQSGFSTQSIMCVPMKADGHIIGVIELMNMRPDFLSDDGLKILTVIADHAALAIENARLLTETRQRSEEQALLFEAMAIVTSDLALETVLDAVSRQMVEALKADICLISHWERMENRLRTMQSYAVPGFERLVQDVQVLDNTSLPFSILFSQTSEVLEAGTANLIPQGAARLKELEVEALLLVPLIYRRQTIGLVEIGRTRSLAPITQGELRLAETMAAQAAVAIEHARLYDEMTRRLAEAKVLQEVMVAAASTLDFNRVLSGTIEALHRTLGIERLGFFLPSDDGETVVAHPATIGFPQKDGNLNLPMERSAAGWVIRNARPLSIPDVNQSEHYYELASDTRSEMCVPVTLHGKVVAVLNAESSRVHAFDADELRLFSAIAAELAVALENARLFEEIRAAEENYRDLFDNANDFIFTVDSNFRISSANKMLLKSCGYQHDEIIGTHITQFVKREDVPKLYKLLKDRLASPDAATTFELPVMAKDEHEILLEITIRIRRDGQKADGIHGIARDITHRRELERQLQQTEKLSAIGKLVAGVAHELNNPLTTIVGYTSLLQNSDLPPVYQNDLDIIHRQAERARLIVRDLLTFARRFDLETGPVDINAVINSSLSLMNAELRSHNIQVNPMLDLELPQTMADSHQLEQVFINLINNAIQALNTVDRPRQLTIESKQVNRSIHLTFTDNGPGIPKNIINRIFDPFFSTKQVGEGTGLGLSICFGIISEHKGWIKAENASDGGAIFRIELPIKEPDYLQPVEKVARPVLTVSPINLKILAVDDEIPLLNLLCRVLNQLGHTVETAQDGKTALQQVESRNYDLIICDVLMPDILGPELYEKILEKSPTMIDRFIFITGNIVDIDTRIFLEKSGLPWLAKPFLPEDIRRVIEQTVAKIKPPVEGQPLQ
jgi:two-component system NtrC family sensor kinase